MVRKKLYEYRINRLGSLQGHYVTASSRQEAIKLFREHKDISENEPIEIHTWKIRQKGHHYPNKLTKYAAFHMRVVPEANREKRKLRSMT